jgi:hypothetical protein
LKQVLNFYRPREIKRALMGIGGLTIVYNANPRYMNFGTDTARGAANYNPDEGEPNHLVLLVGWDDDYPRTNFAPVNGRLPRGNGAWKIQNSWGEELGDAGFFWISYEDTSIFGKSFTNRPADQDIRGFIPAQAYILEPLDAYDGIYFHDPLGVCEIVADLEAGEVTLGNVFTATRDEKIVSVGFFTVNENLRHEIQIYKDIPDGQSPDAGRPAMAEPQKTWTGPMGYYSIELEKPVQLRKGERFAVAVTHKADRLSYPPNFVKVPVEMMMPGYSDNVTVRPGESYLYWEGVWRDGYDDVKVNTDADALSSRSFNFNVKAFTVGSP